MKSVRLLPVVIFAALALLLFKGIGLVTNGGYVLTGSNAVLAAGEARCTARRRALRGMRRRPKSCSAILNPTVGDTLADHGHPR